MKLKEILRDRIVPDYCIEVAKEGIRIYLLPLAFVINYFERKIKRENSYDKIE